MATASLWLLISLHDTPRNRERNKLLLRPLLVLIMQRQQYLKYALQNLCYACHSRRPLPLRSLCQCQTHTHTNQQTQVEPGERNRNNKNFAAAESVQWLSLGASWQAAAPLEASNEALSKFGRSCRWQLLTCQLFESLQVARSSKHQIRDNVKHFLSNLWLSFDVAEVPLKSEIIMKEMKINNFDYLKFKYKE